MSTPPNAVLPAPRRFSIRLPRPLWIGVAAGVLIAATIGLRVGLPICKQRAAIQEIQRLGGRVVARPRGPEWLRSRAGEERMKIICDVTEVWLSKKHATDATLTRLKGLTHLQELWLNE